MTFHAWQQLREAEQIWCRRTPRESDSELSAWQNAFDAAEIILNILDDDDPVCASTAQLAEHLLALAESRGVAAWMLSSDSDPGLTQTVTEYVVSGKYNTEIELLLGSWDPPGSGLIQLVNTHSQLHDPDHGCAWVRDQNHYTLAHYALEETHELIEAIENSSHSDDDRSHIAEELGDLLLQVVFHSAIAENSGHFTIDDVAAALTEKLIHRNPHVFGDEQSTDAEDIAQRWEEKKAEEKSHRPLLDGVPSTLPALVRAQKVIQRANNAQKSVVTSSCQHNGTTHDAVGHDLFQLVNHAQRHDVDAETALRRHTAKVISQLLDKDQTS